VIVGFVDIGGIVDHHCLHFNKTNNHLSPKESVNSDGQQFHQYQKNKQPPLTFKFKQ
jgi:hypothetical protein